jgi:DNA-binding MarR family transcriptional regulator
MPSYAQPPIPPEVGGLVSGLGMNQVRVAILVALARADGALDTTAIIDTIGVPATTVLGSLKALEAAGYVTASEPAGKRRGGRRVVWTLQPDAVVHELTAIIKLITS